MNRSAATSTSPFVNRLLVSVRHLPCLPIALVIGGALTSSASAQNIYTCRDQAGRTITADRPIAECAGVMRELGPTGILRREIAPPLTADQQRQKESDDRNKRMADEAVREKRRRDTALLAAYQTEDQIETARRRAVADADDSIKSSRVRLDDLAKEKKALAVENDAYRNKTPPPLFRRKLDDNQALIDDEEASIKMRQFDVERINQHYDDDLKRYRELSAPARTSQK